MLTRDARITVIERIRRDPELARGVLEDAIDLISGAEPGAARIQLRDLVHATTPFEGLASATGIPVKTSPGALSRNRALALRLGNRCPTSADLPPAVNRNCGSAVLQL